MKKTIVRALSTAALLSTVYAGTALADTYKVEKGDTLSKIAGKYDTTVNEIKTANRLKSDFLSVNQMLKINVASKMTQLSQPATYTVVKGDALIKIANRFHVTVGELKQWNKLDTTIIHVGQKLKVSASNQTTTKTTPVKKPVTPAPKPQTTTASTGVYTVQSGDYLGKIAGKHETTVTNLKALNKLKSDMIYVGQKLKVPTKKAALTPAKPATPKPPVKTTPPKTPVKITPVVKQPETTEYIVKSGDTLGRIAGKYQLSVKELKELNKLSSDRIYVGQKLKVPGTKTQTEPTVDTELVAKMITSAKKLIGIPYVWGGSTPSGFDCSGFIYYVANQAGMDIGRYSAEGYYDRTYYVDTPKAGDIVFFENTYKRGISHLGIYLGNNQFIHANDSGVMISNLQGAYYQAHFESFKRFY
ncbi:C40 family peptidase [Neobacillus drentensis]|uniref:C40 family peptidase n=1 Tax=Neobacillus drentensis TaxID=220684 RepID=UPI002FFED464